MSFLRLMMAGCVACVGLLAAACNRPGDSPGDGRPQIVATTSVLGDVVRNVVGDSADVVVLIPDGVDAHEFQPSPGQIAQAQKADLLVVNGSGLEEHLDDVIQRTRGGGVEVFTATDHIAVRTSDDGTADPHFWTDPVAMQQVVSALGEELAGRFGPDTAQRATDYRAALAQLQAGDEAAVATVAPQRRLLVTGHDDLGYWAERYGFRVVGAVVPSTSTNAEASAADIAALEQTIRDTGAPALFTEAGTSQVLAQRIAQDTGVEVVEVQVERLPADGTYIGLVQELTTTITTHLGESAG